MQSKGSGIRKAAAAYNIVAQNQRPPRPILSNEQVSDITQAVLNGDAEYVHQHLFDDPAAEYREVEVPRPWLVASVRNLMKTCQLEKRAQEEIKRLEQEIPRYLTYLKDERLRLGEAIRLLRGSDSIPGHHLASVLEQDLTSFLNRCRRSLSELKLLRWEIYPGGANDEVWTNKQWSQTLPNGSVWMRASPGRAKECRSRRLRTSYA